MAGKKTTDTNANAQVSTSSAKTVTATNKTATTNKTVQSDTVETGSKTTMTSTPTATHTDETTAVKNSNLIRGKFQSYAAAADEEYMSPAQLAHFKKILNDWKQELMNEVDRTVGHMKDESANLPDPADRATQEEEFSLELRTRDRERKLIKKIDKTLKAIEGDDYGYCEDCGIEIGLKRLEARPTATLCIDCKTLAEIKEKQFRS